MSHLERERCRGFALIIALTLMSFAVFLVVALTILVTAESASQRARIDRQAARNVAMSSFKIALGELQKHAGPDQRITSSGEILASTSDHKLKYTGVWGSDPTSPTYGKPLSWLVSKSDLQDTLTYIESDVPSSSVVLVSERAGDLLESVPSVKAETLSMSTGVESFEGKYAWWIGDEGVKARINLDSSNHSTLDGNISTIINSAFNSRVSIESMDGFNFLLDAQPKEELIADLSRATSLESLLQFNNDDTYRDTVKGRFHDLTADSNSLLVDVRTGSLKRDLTAGLQAGVNYIELDEDRNPDGVDVVPGSLQSQGIFPPQWGGPTDEDPGGPKWEQLRDFFNYKVEGTDEGTIFLKKGSDDTLSIAPVLTLAHVYVHAYKINEYSVRFYVIPAFSIWNPYQHKLSVPEFYIGADLQDPKWRVRGTTTSGDAIDRRAGNYLVSSFERVIKFKVPSTTFEPGEVITFTLNSHSNYSSGVPLLTGSGASDIPDSGFGLYQDVVGNPASINLNGDLWLYYEEATGNANFYFSEVDANWDTSSFAQFRRLMMWWHGSTGNDLNANPAAFENKRISGSVSTPLPGVRPVSNPRIGYYGVMRLAQSSLNMESFTNIPDDHLFLAHYNVRSTYSGRSPSEYMSPYDNGAYNTNPLYTSGFMQDDTHFLDSSNSTTGLAAIGSGIFQAAYFELPREAVPIVSMGQFMHAGLSRTNDHQNENDGWLFSSYQPSFAIGNSLADPRIDSRKKYRNWKELFADRSGTHYDLSYLLNDTLWDSYFLSALPRTADKPLTSANSRIKVVGNPRVDQLVGNGLDGGYKTAAEHLMFEGAFNVNSTSASAWKSLIMGLFESDVLTSSGVVQNFGRSPVTRVAVPVEGAIQAIDDEFSPKSYLGYRSISPEEATLLSREIVSEIKEQTNLMGRPFFSLSEFINRSLSLSSQKHQLKGLLQRAILGSGVNAAWQQSGRVLELTSSQKGSLESNGSNRTGIVGDHVVGDKLFGIPGYLTQADLLAKFGHFLTPRSDTFRIRSYGAVIDEITGEERSEVWLEAIVQRVPQTVDSEDSIESPSGPMGRKFIVVSMRWLDDEDV